MGVVSSLLRKRSTSFSVPATLMPDFSARNDEAWMAGPSAMGSENGMPSSMMSAPMCGSFSKIANEVSASGSPAVMKGMNPARSAARSSSKRRVMRFVTIPPTRTASAFAAAVGPPHVGGGGNFLVRHRRRSQFFAQGGGDGEDVLVAAPRQADDDQLVLRHFRRHTRDMGDGMRRFERRNDAFQAARQLKRIECFLVCGRDIDDTARFLEPGMLRSNAWIIEPGRNRMRLEHLAVRILKQI